MEKKVTIKTDATHHLNGVLNTPEKEADQLVIFVHGLTGSSNEHLFYCASREFPKQGFAIFRFDFYPEAKAGSRTLQESTLKTHVGDLTAVVRYWSKKYKKIYLVGHSLGGLTILLSGNLPVEAVVLWDSSCNLMGTGLMGVMQATTYSKQIDSYIINWGTETLLGAKMYQEFKTVPGPKQLLENYKVPLKIVSAGKGILVSAGKAYYRYAHEPKELAMVKNATHCFDEEGTQERLFAETLSWIKKF